MVSCKKNLLERFYFIALCSTADISALFLLLWVISKEQDIKIYHSTRKFYGDKVKSLKITSYN